MFSDPVMIAELLQVTKDLIDNNPWEISFTRRAWERVPGGGQRQKDPQDLPSQRVYLGAVSADASYFVTVEGNRVMADYVIVGLPELDVEEKDSFELFDRTFEVVEIHPDRQYETRAWCVDRT